jgi:DNA-binding response OmpR family regulator
MVEDDVNLGYLLKENFATKGYHIHLCRDGNEGLYEATNNHYDMLILDVMMPKKDGFTLATQIRKTDQQTPIIFLTAKSLEQDRVTGFTIGCDDYVTKPFSANELLLRIKAILRRSQQSSRITTEHHPVQIGKFTFNYTNRHLQHEDQVQNLSTKEADLLHFFCEHKNILIPRKDILVKVWGSDDYFAGKSMDVYLTRLRKLLKSDTNLEIQNVHGTGFRLMEKPAHADVTSS